MAKRTLKFRRQELIGKLFGFEVHITFPVDIGMPDRSFHLGNARQWFDKALTHEAFFSLLKSVLKP